MHKFSIRSLRILTAALALCLLFGCSDPSLNNSSEINSALSSYRTTSSVSFPPVSWGNSSSAPSIVSEPLPPVLLLKFAVTGSNSDSIPYNLYYYYRSEGKPPNDYMTNFRSISACYAAIAAADEFNRSRAYERPYDLAFAPWSEELAKSFETGGFTFGKVPVAKDAVISVTRTKEPKEQPQFNLTSEQIHAVFFESKTVYVNDEGVQKRLVPVGGYSQTEIPELLDIHYETFPDTVISDFGELDNPATVDVGDDSVVLIWPAYYIHGTRGPAGLNGVIASIDGITPDIDNIVDGTYSYSVTYYAIFDSNNAEAKALAELLGSDKGQNEILNNAAIANLRGESDYR